MRVHPLLGAAAMVGFAACQSQAAHQHEHWTGYAVGPSMSRNLLGYEAEKDGMYRDFQWRRKKNIEMTLRRHFFNHNPDNPFEPYDPTVYEPRRPHSLFPAPHRYIHVEGLVLGAATMTFATTFIPIPVDSIIGTMEEGGDEEFVEGMGVAFRPAGQATASFLHDYMGFPETQGDDWRHAADSDRPAGKESPQ